MNSQTNPIGFELSTIEGVFKGDPIFSCLRKHERSALLKTAHRHVFEKGDTLLCEGNVTDRFFLIATGELSIFKATPSGDEKLFGYFREGQIVELFSAFLDEPVFALSGRGSQDGIAYSFANATLMKIVEENSLLARRLLKYTSEKVQSFVTQVDFFTSSSATERLAVFLYALSKAQNTSNLTLPCRQKEIASRLGVREETISRILTRFRINKIIDQRNGNTVILDLRALEELIGEQYTRLDILL